MPSPYDLTTVQAVKDWQSLSSADSDAVLGSLISSSSRAILAYIERPIILPKVWTESYDLRTGMRRTVLRNWPVVSVGSVQVGLTLLQAVNPLSPAPYSGYGYVVDSDPAGGAPPGAPMGINHLDDPSSLAIYRQRGMQVTYTAGYQDTDAFTVPVGGGPQTATPLYGNWASDMGVVYAATGTALTLVASAPAAGQYSVAAGVYTFAAADAGKAVVAAFGYVPFDLAQACLELVALRFVQGSSVGLNSKSLGGQETISYARSSLPDTVMKFAQPYKRVTLI